MLKLVLSAVTICGVLYANDAKIQPKDLNQEVKIDKHKVEKFVLAALNINMIKAEIEQNMQTKYQGKERPSQEEIQEANKLFVTKANEAIQKQNLTMDKYNYYIQLLEKDENFKAQVQALAREINKR